MVIEPAFGTFGSVGRCQVLLEKLTALQRKIDGDQNGQWELAVKLECGYSP